MVGEYVGRTYVETLRRPMFVVSETLNVEPRHTSDAAPAYAAVRESGARQDAGVGAGPGG
jgi:hypothetical protein